MGGNPSDIDKLNELIDRLRAGKLAGTLEILLDGASIFVSNKEGAGETRNTLQTIVFPRKDLSYLDVREMDVSGSDFSGLRLRKAEFSGSRIVDGDFSGSDLEGTAFTGAFITETRMERAYNINVRGSYLTGSVNLNEANAHEGGGTYQLHPSPGEVNDGAYSSQNIAFDGNHYPERKKGGSAGGRY
jgi:uncharacterized protein YjbI with pentapeptide repeats